MFGLLQKRLAGHMPQDVFNAGAISIAWIHLHTSKPIAVVAAELAAAYRGSYIADGFEAEWLAAAAEIVLMQKKLFPAADSRGLAMAVRQIQYCATTFDQDGAKRKRRWLNGTWFTKDERKATDRPEQCRKAIAIYMAGSLSGKFPIAPADWTLS